MGVSVDGNRRDQMGGRMDGESTGRDNLNLGASFE